MKSFPEACTSSINKHGFLVERDQTYVEEFFKSICPNFSETFISDKSVWGEPIFKTTCVTTANSWNVFNQLKCKYSKLSQKDRESNMKNNIKQIERLEDLINYFHQYYCVNWTRSFSKKLCSKEGANS